jgi:aspartate racemase
MKTLGLIGGLTWLSTVEYYRAINEQVNARLGGRHSAKLILYSLDFAEFQPPLPEDEAGWADIARRFGDAAARLESAGAEALVLCANTPHKVAPAIRSRTRLPLVHIADATANAVAAKRIERVALLGTRPTMEATFYPEILAARGISTLVPDPEDRAWIHASIFDELTKGVFTDATRQRYLALVERLVARGAQGVILGCTEIPLLLREGDCTVPTFDTTLLHVGAAVDFALPGESGAWSYQ